MSKKRPQPSPFNVGDRVKYVGGAGHGWPVGEEHIIHGVCYEGEGEWEYATHRGSWFTPENFSLISRADSDSLEQLDALLNEEYGDE